MENEIMQSVLSGDVEWETVEIENDFGMRLCASNYGALCYISKRTVALIIIKRDV